MQFQAIFVQFPAVFAQFPAVVVQFSVVPGGGSVAPGASLCSSPGVSVQSPARGAGRLNCIIFGPNDQIEWRIGVIESVAL